MSDAAALAARLLDALVRVDPALLRDCFTSGAILRGLVPPGLREERGVDAVVGRLAKWLGGLEDLRLVDMTTYPVGDRIYVRYRLAGRHPEDGPSFVEQHAYLWTEEGRITRMHLVCSGRIVGEAAPARR